MNNIELDVLRNQIDDIDSKLCQLIKDRQEKFIKYGRIFK